ncbi:MAG: phosphoribosylformylglycinamidine cyclo-ligase [Thermoplasmatota archaeon]
MKGLSYKDAGVDIEEEEKAIEALKDSILFAREGFGAPLKSEFTGLVEFGDYALSICTDGVGTKLIVADIMEKWDTVGIDCIAMNVNDTICQGAEPIAFVDYLAMEKPDPKLTKEIGKGLEKGAELSNMTIIGGETATLSEIINGFDLAGTALGFVKKEEIIDGRNVKEGDKIIGLPSSGIHSNGFTLARKIVEKSCYTYHDKLEMGVIGRELLKPTEIYVRPIMNVLKNFNIKGMANITGGGLKNLKRINPNYRYTIDNPLKPQPLFRFLQEQGNVKDKEMYQTFNMGMGICLIANKEVSEDISEELEGKVIGEVKKGKGVVHKEKDLKFT